MKAVEPIQTVKLFPPLSRELITLLKSLEPGDWGKPTACAAWTVKDVAAHLLGGSLGRLKSSNEKPRTPPSPMTDYDEILRTINQSNEAWVEAARRINPELLIEFLELSDRHLYDHFKSLDPEQPARITVAWASDRLPPNWFDIAREYTEKWLHQSHIREAINRPLLSERKWLFPVYDTFIRGLPGTFRNVQARNSASVTVEISGEAGGEWTLVRGKTEWGLFVGRDPRAFSHVRIDQGLAWRLFSKGITVEAARQEVQIDGDKDLGEKVLEMVSIMA